MYSLFSTLLGHSFNELAPSIQKIHSIQGTQCYSGKTTVRRGNHWLSRLCGWVAELPPAGDNISITVEFSTSEKGEYWRRNFNGHKMNSFLWKNPNLPILNERLSIINFEMAIQQKQQSIEWKIAKVKLFNLIPLPLFLFKQIHCREYEEQGKYHFLVDVYLPKIGLLVHYNGWLEPDIS